LIFKTKQLLTHCWKIDRRKAHELLQVITTVFENISSFYKHPLQHPSLSIEETKMSLVVEYAATQIQAISRGFVARKKLARYLAAQAEAQKEELRVWSAINIQRVARSYIARKTIVRSFKIRKTLSHEVLHIAERYLQGGDMWGFLKEIDGELSRVQSEMAENEGREHDWAANFVQKVVVQRQTEFDESWERFPRALAQFSHKPSTEGTLLDRNTSNERSTAATGNKLLHQSAKKNTTNTTSHVSSTANTSATRPGEKKSLAITVADVAAANSKHFRNLPGPLVRKAVSTTVQVEVASELNRLVNSDFLSRKLAQDIRSVYGPDSDPTPQSLAVTARKGPRQQIVGASKASVTVGSPPPKKRKQRVGIDGKPVELVGRISATHTTDWMSTAASATNTSSDTNTLRPSTGKTAIAPVQPGNTLLLDVPQGLEDSIERLLHAAALRCFVPDFFQGVTLPEDTLSATRGYGETEGDDPEETALQRRSKKTSKNINADASYAYQMYLNLPMGLAKMRYEVECRKFSQGTINKLRLKGLNYLRDVSPVSKFIMCLKSVDAPRVLLNTTVDLYIEIRNLGTSTLGGAHKDTLQQFTKIKPITMPDPVEVVSSPARSKRVGSPGAASRTSPPSRMMASKSLKLPSPKSRGSTRPSTATSATNTDNNDVVALVVVEEELVETSPNKKKKKKKGYRGGYSNEPLDEEEGAEVHAQSANEGEMDRRMDKSEVPGQLLVSLVEEDGVWCSLKATVEDLFLHAAFLVVPHRRRRMDRRSGEMVESETAMGNVSFKEHTKDLLKCATEEERREAVKERFRAAFILTTPFCLYLKNKRVYVVEDLMSVDLGDLQLPPPLRTQIEALLVIVVAKCSDSRLMPVPRDLLSTAAELFTVPMLYDPRFQRSPFDPYGRPPRLQKGGVKVLSKLKSVDEGLARDAAALVDMNRVASTAQVAMHLKEPVSLWVPKMQARKKKVVKSTHGEDETGSLEGSDEGFEQQGAEEREDEEEEEEMAGVASQDSKWTFHVDAHEKRHPSGSATNSLQSGQSGDAQLANNTVLNSLSQVLTAPPPRGALPPVVKKPVNKLKQPPQQQQQGFSQSQDFRLTNLINDQVFKHSYMCPHARCGQVFSRLYTYKIHLKSHERFAGYHNYKRQPQLYLDADSSEASGVSEARRVQSVSLPPVIAKEFSTMTL
jgi:hypothetical protein